MISCLVFFFNYSQYRLQVKEQGVRFSLLQNHNRHHCARRRHYDRKRHKHADPKKWRGPALKQVDFISHTAEDLTVRLYV